ncbi:uncharacterized protein LOC128243184 isoform X1 [Mya arenaria]|uniref:uncharacterized protein LOC128243184 isoform X1 n=1 Tax=Mya arenaria TaxID=6604 RepID=UPI0022E4D0B9|nr:uncharacterized protein LOC128243184 isoform X1 [Mya arenaria]
MLTVDRRFVAKNVAKYGLILLVLSVTVYLVKRSPESGIDGKDNLLVKIPLDDGRPCNATFRQADADNFRKIESYRFPGVDRYTAELFPTTTPGLSSGPVTGDDIVSPALVTAFSSNHYLESKFLFKNIDDVVRPQYPDVKVIVYGLGLSTGVKQKLLTFCKCEIREFNFDLYPDHVEIIFGYTWKPIVLQEVAREHPFSIWMDTSVRFTDKDLRPFFENAKRLGVVVTKNTGPIAMRTHTKTFQFLGENPCTFRDRNEFQGGFVMLYSNPTTVQYFMKPWVSCALTLGCMLPDYSARDYIDCGKHGNVYFDCHRFDQSVLGILLSRTYGLKVDDHGVDTRSYHSFCKGNDDSFYLPSFISVEPLIEKYREDCY